MFQGDSITDGGRNYEDLSDLGNGYARKLAEIISAILPDISLTFYNRGVGGNRTQDMMLRWENECLDLKPDVLFLLIGINDVLRNYDAGEQNTDDAYRQQILKAVILAKENGVREMVFIQPFLMNFADEAASMHKDLEGKTSALKEIADEHNILFVEMETFIQQLLKNQKSAIWTYDNIHPTSVGHMAIALRLAEELGFIEKR